MARAIRDRNWSGFPKNLWTFSVTGIFLVLVGRGWRDGAHVDDVNILKMDGSWRHI